MVNSMKMESIIEFRKANNQPDSTDLDYPYSCIDGGHYLSLENGRGYHYGYSLNPDSDVCIVKRLITQTSIPDAGDFPDSVHKYIWIHPGRYDEENWYALMVLNDGRYAFYEAGCDYTGFDCRGYMNLYIDSSWSDIINFGLTDDAYIRYLAETSST